MKTDKLSLWIESLRAHSLFLSAAPILIGSAAAFSDGGFHAGAALSSLAVTVFMQLAVNLSNDYFDLKSGVDELEGLGGRRAIHNGEIAPVKILAAAAVFLMLGAAAGVYLILRAGIILLIPGALAAAAAWFYTAPPIKYGYRGGGEAVILLFYGFIAVGGSYYVQTLKLSPILIPLSLGIGALSCSVLVVNNIRDFDSDKAADKKTLAVIFGRGFAKAEYIVLIATAAISSGALLFYDSHMPLVLLSIPGLLILMPALKFILQDGRGAALNLSLVQTVNAALLYSLLLSAGLVIPRLLQSSPS